MVSTPSCGRGGCGSINVKHNYACIPDCKCTRGYISLVQYSDIIVNVANGGVVHGRTRKNRRHILHI